MKCVELTFTIVKLHSDLRILTQLQLVGVGVDFVFPMEGRKSSLIKTGQVNLYQVKLSKDRSSQVGEEQI